MNDDASECVAASEAQAKAGAFEIAKVNAILALVHVVDDLRGSIDSMLSQIGVVGDGSPEPAEQIRQQ